MNGFINVLKPPGISSSHAVGIVKRIYDQKKVGHTGTLDPAAAGVLPICIGRATKFSDYVMRGDKEYIAEITFGLSTDTLDSLGKITQVNDNTDIEKSQLEKTLRSFIGWITQTVPAYSAVKKNGQPLYKSALKDQKTLLPTRNVYIKSVEVLSGEKNRFLLRISCSKGTYIRTLIDDIGRSLNSCAYTSFLLRTKNGIFNIDNAYTLDELENNESKEKLLIAVPDALSEFPKLELNDYLFDIVTTGSAIDTERAKIITERNTDYRVYCRDVFIGVGSSKDGKLKIKSFFYLRGDIENTN